MKYCLRILHLPTRLPSTPSTQPLIGLTFEHHLTAEDPPSETKPEVKRRRVYFTLTLPPLCPPGPLPLHFSYCTCPRVVAYPFPSSSRFHNVSRVGFSGDGRLIFLKFRFTISAQFVVDMITVTLWMYRYVCKYAFQLGCFREFLLGVLARTMYRAWVSLSVEASRF